jgi:hypothetical protein
MLGNVTASKYFSNKKNNFYNMSWHVKWNETWAYIYPFSFHSAETNQAFMHLKSTVCHSVFVFSKPPYLINSKIAK